MKCRKCGSSKSVKNGKRGGKQCYKCKDCGFQYTQEESFGRSEPERNKAIALYLLGLSMRAVAKLFRVNVSTILYWIRSFAIKTSEKPTPQGPVIIELDEMWHFIKSKKTSAGYGRLIVALPVSSLTGNVEIVVAKL
jgi:transposase-like protein